MDEEKGKAGASDSDKTANQAKGKRYERDRRGNRSRLEKKISETAEEKGKIDGPCLSKTPTATKENSPENLAKDPAVTKEKTDPNVPHLEMESKPETAQNSNRGGGDAVSETVDETAELQKKEEEERMKKEEEEEIKRQESLKLEQELQTLQEFINDASERISIKDQLRVKNKQANGQRPDDSFFRKLDSNLKKNNAFVKKLKSLNESMKDSLTKDFNGLNLTKYISEAASGITEAKLKMSDIPCALHISSLLHQRYADFSSTFLENWQKVLPSKKDDKVSNPSKLRVDLRLFAELVVAGIFQEKEGLGLLANQLRLLVITDQEEHNYLPIIISFCKHCGDDYAGLLPRKIRLLAEKHNREIPRSSFLPAERQRACKNLLREYYTSLSKHLLVAHKEALNQQKHNRRTLQTKGELSAARKDDYEAMYQTYQKLLANTMTLSDLLDEDMPDLPQEEIQADAEAAVLDIYMPSRDFEYQYDGETSLFEDEDTRAFYENIQDLKAKIPAILYKDSLALNKDDDSSTNEAQLLEEVGDDSLEVEDVERELEEVAIELDEEGENIQDPTTAAAEDQDEDDELSGSSMKLILEAYLQNLPNCVNRELIDNAAIEFCMSLNTKVNRRKLVKALFLVHRTRYDLLPFYARLVATLQPCMPDVSVNLTTMLKQDFKYRVKKKDQISIESKLKTVRFLGELVKFNLFAKPEILHCLKMLLFDLKHHNIEMACALLESCGRFLYRSPDSHHRTKIYLDVMMRKKTAEVIDSRYVTMIENAYYFCNPPEVKKFTEKERTPIQQYIRKLLYKDLTKVTTEKVLRQIRKLDWDDDEVSQYVTKCICNIWNVRYNSIHCAANLLAGLAVYYEKAGMTVVDQVLEDIRTGMEVNHPKFNQRRVSSVKFLGELYNYRMVDSAVIFKTLYSLILFAVTLNDGAYTALDPPEHLFRLRLVCVLLDTCGQYFDRGSSKKKLDYFLVYFQRYYLFKKNLPVWPEERPFPIDVVNMIRETIEAVRPKLVQFKTYEEACAAAKELDEQFRAKFEEIMPKVKDDDQPGIMLDEGMMEEEEEDGRLPTITENEDDIDELGATHSLSQLNLTDERNTSGSEAVDFTDPRSGSQMDGMGERDNDMTDEDDDDDDDDDQEVTGLGGPKLMECQEDEDFLTAFDKMLSETIRSQEMIKQPQVDIPIPMNLQGQRREKRYEEEDAGTIHFTLLTKKGKTTNIDVPMSENFATKFIEREQEEQAEKQRLKRVTLNIHERQEEEDYQEMIAGMQKSIVYTPRERKQTYQHPKGAPANVEAIFGSTRK